MPPSPQHRVCSSVGGQRHPCGHLSHGPLRTTHDSFEVTWRSSHRDGGALKVEILSP
jgi:hypothetical protein